MMHKLISIPALIFGISLAASAYADGRLQQIITKADSVRLENYEATRKAAIAEARAGSKVADFAVLEPLLADRAANMRNFDFSGEWKCRTLKLGKTLPLVIYSWFSCRVTDDAAGLRLEKLGGSQRTAGAFFDDGDNRMVYLGSQFLRGQSAQPYGTAPLSDQAGYVFVSNGTDWRIEFPAPIMESAFDVLEFKRR